MTRVIALLVLAAAAAVAQEHSWKANVGGQVSAGPMTYAAGGPQCVAIAAGSAPFVYALRQ